MEKDFYAYKIEEKIKNQVESIDDLFSFCLGMYLDLYSEEELNKVWEQAKPHKSKFENRVKQCSLDEKFNFLNIIYFNSRLITSAINSVFETKEYPNKKKQISEMIIYFYQILYDDMEDSIKLNNLYENKNEKQYSKNIIDFKKKENKNETIKRS